MLKVALTGGIATGKSYALAWFHRHGVACLDADELAHGTMVAGSQVTTAIVERFGERVLGADGAVDRRVLGSIVFADEVARRALEALVHPPVYRAIAAALQVIERIEHPPLAIVAVPLLYETGHAADFDRVVATVCETERQLARLLERGLTEVDARRRLSAQWPAEEKAARADHVIRTDGTFEESDRQLDAVLRLLLQ